MEYRHYQNLAVFITPLGRQLARDAVWARTSVEQTLTTFPLKATYPLGSGLRADIELGSSRAQGQEVLDNASHQFFARDGSESYVLM